MKFRLILLFSFFIFFQAKATQVSLGMSAANGYEEYIKEASDLNISDHAVLYLSIWKEFKKLPYESFPKNKNIILALKFPNEKQVLKNIVAGKFDQNFKVITQAIRQDGRKIFIRPMYEFNGNWYPWHAYHKNNKPEDAVPALRYIVSFFRQQAPGLIKVDLNYNRRSAKGNVKDFAMLYPGDDYIDRITVSNYNRCGSSANAQKIESFADGFREAYQQLEKISQRPIGVAEVASTDLCGVDRLKWYQEMLQAIREEFPRVDNVTFFFETIPIGAASNTVPIVWGLRRYERKAFGQLVTSFKQNKPLMYDEDAKKKSLLERLGEPKLPWSVYVRGEHYFNDAYNDAQNPITHQEFGAVGQLIRVHFSQGMKWEVVNSHFFILKGTIGGVLSPNKNQWWNNQLFIRTEGRFCQKSEALWGENCIVGGTGYIEYFAELPERYGHGILGKGKERQWYVGIEMNFGGDWSY